MRGDLRHHLIDSAPVELLLLKARKFSRACWRRGEMALFALLNGDSYASLTRDSFDWKGLAGTGDFVKKVSPSDWSD